MDEDQKEKQEKNEAYNFEGKNNLIYTNESNKYLN